MDTNGIANAARGSVDGNGPSSSIDRMTRGTVFLLALGLGASCIGAMLLCTAPASGTARALESAGNEIAHASRIASYVESQPVTSVEVRAPIPGRVAAVRFEPGAYVRKGETLLLLDPTPFAGALEQAREAVATARTRLGAATAALGRAQRAFDDGEIGERELHARVQEQRDAHGALRAAAEALEQAQHELALTRIAAPIGGRIDEVRVSVGDRVTAAPEGGVLVRIVAPGEIYADAGTAPWSSRRLLADRRAINGA